VAYVADVFRIAFFSVGQDCGECDVGQVICKAKDNEKSVCVDRNLVCNQHFDCSMNEDENDCNVDYSQIFNCSDQSTYIPLYRQCDNRTSGCAALFEVRKPSPPRFTNGLRACLISGRSRVWIPKAGQILHSVANG